jgi:hypothetical protein
MSIEAASATKHAVEFNRRELLAMRLMLDSRRRDHDAAANGDDDASEQLLAAIVAAANDPQHSIPEHLQQFPWFPIVVRFVSTRRDGDVLQERCTNALLTAMPASVRARTFGQLVLNLALRIRVPADDVLQPEAATRAERLLDSVRRAMTTDDNGALMTVAEEFIALAVRAYDAIANELRWLVVPRVVQRCFQCKQTTAAWSNCVCAPRLPTLRAALMCACAPDEISAHHTALLTRARLFVLLFDCVEHYLRVGGASFVRRAVVELLDGAAEIDDDRDESLLHLFADLLCASIVRVGDASEPVLFRPTEVVANAERVVVFRQHPVDGTWCVGVVARADGVDDVRVLTASRSCHTKLFNMLRLGQEVLDAPDRPPVTLEGLRRLVGEATKWLNSDAIHGLLTLAVRDVAGVRLFDSLLLDQDQPAQLSKNIRRACGGSATKLVMPWNERQGHWSLLCLDLISLTAVFYDSLDGSVSERMRSFCAAAFGKRWRGWIEKMPSPQQEDAHNCGVFVVANAVHWMRSGAVPEAYEVTARTRLLLARTWLLGEALSLEALRRQVQ